ncbi:MAG: double-strand break repair protein AddB [Pseudomonadota bacterium]
MEISTSPESTTASNSSDRPFASNVFSIPSRCNFLHVLVESLMNGRIVPEFVPAQNPLLLLQATIFVPNRRTARALSVAFLEASNAKAQLLPRIKTLGDTEDDSFGLLPEAEDLDYLPKAVGTLERKLELANLIRHWVDSLSLESKRLYGDEDIFIPSSQADAVRLADDLCRLLDQITQEEINWNAIQNIIPEEHAQWWSITSTFLKIIMETWPQVLEEQGLIDPAEKARRQIERRIGFYRTRGASGPVIVAGSTGSVPSTQRFLQVVSGLGNGAVVLPGLDTDMPDVEWRTLSMDPAKSRETLETHPQFGIAKLLETIGVDRDSVIELSGHSTTPEVRSRTVSTALALPVFSASWKDGFSGIDSGKLEQAFKGVSLVEAANERQEAIAIAIALRETLEDSGKTAALVTPDRNLARRVKVELKRFDIDVDDTAGSPLLSSPVGMFVRMLIRFCFDVNSKAELASLLKSPFLLAGTSVQQARKNAELVEMLALRGSVGTPACGHLREFVEDRHAQLSRQGRLKEQEGEQHRNWQQILDYAQTLHTILTPLAALSDAKGVQKLATYILKLLDVLTETTINEHGDSSIANSSGTKELQDLFEEILGGDAANFEVLPHDFPSVFEALVAPVTVRQNQATHPRLHIYGPLEIRLLSHDRIIMAGLNEGTWPLATRNDAFLNRTMRQQLGMASPERRIGLAAHDFQQIMGTSEVFLSRASRVDKAPTIASRWLQRMFALLGHEQTKKIRDRGTQYLLYASRLDEEDQKTGRQSRPNPKPPVAVRPKSLPVTDIETWIRDPYALYAKRILGLRPLQPLEREPDHLLLGTLYHSIFEEYVSPDNMKMELKDRFTKLGEIAVQKISDEKLASDIAMVWQYRFAEIAKQFVEWEEQYFTETPASKTLKELDGKLLLSNGGFLLHARADRIDLLEDGRISVLDYKTGSSPSLKQARSLSPQMALEGAIAEAGGFMDVGKAELAEIAFIRLIQGKKFGLQSISDNKNPIPDIISQTQANLEALIAQYQNEDTGYVSRRAPFRDGDISGDYDHLARTREWSFGEEGDSDE